MRLQQISAACDPRVGLQVVYTVSEIHKSAAEGGVRVHLLGLASDDHDADETISLR